MFWICVFTAYAVLMAIGVFVGTWLSKRFPGKPNGGTEVPAPTTPTEPGGLSTIPDFVPETWVEEFLREPIG